MDNQRTSFSYLGYNEAAIFNSTVTAQTSEMDEFGACIRNLKNMCSYGCEFERTIAVVDMMQCFWFSCLGVIRFILALAYAYGVLLVYAVMLCFVVYVIYKSYFSPVFIIKELTDVGFDHIKSIDRKAAITRARQARRLGSKLPPPYPNGWFALIESADLGVGDVKAVDALGENLCVYRSEDGAARCLDAYCPHLGANMAVGGRVVADCIQCPFHRWRFSGESGACVSVPDLDTPPRGVGVRAWVTRELAGAVWVWYDAGGAPPAWSLPNPSELESPGWGYRGRNEYIVNSHIQDIPENGADVAHLNTVHSPSLLTRLGEKYPFLLHFVGRHAWSAEWTRGDSHAAHMRLSHEYRVGKLSLCRVDIDATQIGPGAVLLPARTMAGPLLVCQSVTPLSPCEQRVVHRVFSPWWNAPLAAAFVYAEASMFERDLTIWNSKRFMSSPAYVRADRSIRAFRAWFSQFYSEKSVSFQQAMRKHCDPLDW